MCRLIWQLLGMLATFSACIFCKVLRVLQKIHAEDAENVASMLRTTEDVAKHA